MVQFRIISTPTGQAPKWVRDAWVGLVFTMANDRNWNATVGALGGKPDLANLDGFSVQADQALAILRASGSEGARAADWWENVSMLAVVPGSGLRFGREFCELVESSDDELP